MKHTHTKKRKTNTKPQASTRGVFDHPMLSLISIGFFHVKYCTVPTVFVPYEKPSFSDIQLAHQRLKVFLNLSKLLPEEVVIASKKKGAYQTKEREGYGSTHVGCYQADWCTCCALTQPAKHRLRSVLADEGVVVFLQLEVKAAFCVTKINNLAQKKQTGKKKITVSVKIKIVSFGVSKLRLLYCVFTALLQRNVSSGRWTKWGDWK